MIVNYFIDDYNNIWLLKAENIYFTREFFCKKKILNILQLRNIKTNFMFPKFPKSRYTTRNHSPFKEELEKLQELVKLNNDKFLLKYNFKVQSFEHVLRNIRQTRFLEKEKRKSLDEENYKKIYPYTNKSYRVNEVLNLKQKSEEPRENSHCKSKNYNFRGKCFALSSESTFATNFNAIQKQNKILFNRKNKNINDLHQAYHFVSSNYLRYIFDKKLRKLRMSKYKILNFK